MRERRRGNSGQDSEPCGLERPGTRELCCLANQAKAASLYLQREGQIIVKLMKHENTVCVGVCLTESKRERECCLQNECSCDVPL